MLATDLVAGSKPMESHASFGDLPSGKVSQKKLWKDPPCSMGKFTISMVIFHGYVTNYQRVDFKGD
jgi:hypothetical protein